MKTGKRQAEKKRFQTSHHNSEFTQFQTKHKRESGVCVFLLGFVRNPLKEEEWEIYVVLVLFGSSDWSFVEARVRLRLYLLHATLAGVEFCCFDEFEVKKDMLWSCGLL
ncbi:hypothetical protein GmHk_01G001015 [Glycine max]|nr:hypothetical protein GmHk_01G001015 [Glycine max]